MNKKEFQELEELCDEMNTIRQEGDIIISYQCSIDEEDGLYIAKLKDRNITFSMPTARTVTFTDAQIHKLMTDLLNILEEETK